jgi:AAA15 family ATPase/GTPase
MIKEIKIENFKSIQSLNLELGRLNVFIGANGSGKSNILEGIALIKAAKENKLDTEFLYARGVRVGDEIYTPSAFKQNNHEPTVITISDNGKFINGLKIHKDGLEFSYDVSEFFDLDEPLVDTKNQRIKSEKFNGSGHTKNSTFMIYAPENTYLRNFTEEGQIKPLGVRGEGLFKLLQKTIKEKPKYFTKINKYLQLIDWVEGIEVPNDLFLGERRINIKDQFIDRVQFIDQRSANEGFLYLLFYLTLFISDDTPKFFAIDNIDNAMNPKLGRELIKTLAKLSKKEEHDKQVILTTHNPAILDGLNLNDDEQRLFVIYRNAYGHTKATRIFKTETPEGQRHLPLSEQFLRGYLGGLPDNF